MTNRKTIMPLRHEATKNHKVFDAFLLETISKLGFPDSQCLRFNTPFAF